jgi:hypothetical protein
MTPFLPTAFAVVMLLEQGVASSVPDPVEDPVIVEFSERVDAYLDLREQVERAVLPLRPADDPEDYAQAVLALVDGIRQARSSAAIGDVLTLDVGMLLRRRTAAALMAAKITDDDVRQFTASSVVWRRGDIAVNDEFPWPLGTDLPVLLMHAMPQLDGPLEFRLLGTALVLVDIDTNLIVDILFNLLPAAPLRAAPPVLQTD